MGVETSVGYEQRQALRDFDERCPATEVAGNGHRVLCSGEAGWGGDTREFHAHAQRYTAGIGEDQRNRAAGLMSSAACL